MVKAAAAFIIGTLSWAGIDLSMIAICALCIPLVFTEHRAWYRLLIASSYYFGVMFNSLAPSTAFFLDINPITAQLMILGLSVINGFALTLPSFFVKSRFIAIVLGLIVIGTPPLGIFGGANPLLAAAVFFPGTGWIGFVLLLAVWALLLRYDDRQYFVTAPIVIIAAVLSAYTRPQLPDATWSGINTDKDFDHGQYTLLDQNLFMRQLGNAATEHSSGFLVFPEASSYGISKSDISRFPPDKHILLGQMTRSEPLSNQLVLIHGGDSQTVYDQRMPIPVGMFKPWNMKESYPLNLFDDGIIEINNQRLGVFICHEGMLLWPWLQTLAARPDELIVIGNGSFTRTNHLSDMQLVTAQAYSLLFGLPLAWSYNY